MWSSKEGIINIGIFTTFPCPRRPSTVFPPPTKNHRPVESGFAHSEFHPESPTCARSEAASRSLVDGGLHGLPIDFKGGDDSTDIHDEGTPYCRVAGALASP
ncbi:hypothetical protein ACLKA6_016229 [Drosophila palustris]